MRKVMLVLQNTHDGQVGQTAKKEISSRRAQDLWANSKNDAALLERPAIIRRCAGTVIRLIMSHCLIYDIGHLVIVA